MNRQEKYEQEIKEEALENALNIFDFCKEKRKLSK